MQHTIKNKRAICKGCGINFQRGNGSKHYCSIECQVKYPKASRKCKPDCNEGSILKREVEFSNGTRHIQALCTVCRYSTYIGKVHGTYEGEAVSFKRELENQAAIRRDKYGDSFYCSPQWLRLRYEAFVKHGRVCMVCGASHGILHVDHIKPKSKHPTLALSLDNLQILCGECNMGKGNWDETDWRFGS